MITLIAPNQEVINLQQALTAQLGSDIPEHLELTIQVPAHQTFTIHDDIISYDKLTTKYTHSITFIVHEHAQLFYDMFITPSYDTPLLQDNSTPVEAPILEKNLTINLVGQHAQATLKCAVLGSQGESFKFKTLQHHQATHTISNLEVRSVLDQQAKLFCNSMIKVEKSAQHTDAHLENKNILLNKGARVVSIPQLEIEANDVKCGHGAAVSKLSNDDLFYLQSRGIDLATTKQLLIEAFLNFS